MNPDFCKGADHVEPPEIHDGGPAFPVLSDGRTHGTEPGMSLRDYFAAQALVGSLGGVPGGHLKPDILAAASYRYADAMLAERAK